MSRLSLRAGLALTVCALAVRGDALADSMGSGVGAMRGAVLGDLIGGAGGAVAGAAIGAMIGAPGAAARKEEQLAQTQSEMDDRLAQWEADQHARELSARESQQQAGQQAGAAAGVDDALMIEIQRSLLDLGYNPGPIGIQSPELTTAIVSYQGDAGLLPNGAMSMELLDQMITDLMTR